MLQSNFVNITLPAYILEKNYEFDLSKETKTAICKLIYSEIILKLNKEFAGESITEENHKKIKQLAKNYTLRSLETLMNKFENELNVNFTD